MNTLRKIPPILAATLAVVTAVIELIEKLREVPESMKENAGDAS